jgi:uncharacterized protein YdhG (YjbR/CyaY superfamily)
MSPRTIANIDDYIATAPPDVRPVLQEIRTIVQDAVPDAEETISYRMPAFKRGRTFVYFAAFKHHVGVFPPVKADPNLEKALRPYRGDKGNLKFPLDRPIPYDLIRRVVKALAAQHATP